MSVSGLYEHVNVIIRCLSVARKATDKANFLRHCLDLDIPGKYDLLVNFYISSFLPLLDGIRRMPLYTHPHCTFSYNSIERLKS